MAPREQNKMQTKINGNQKINGQRKQKEMEKEYPSESFFFFQPLNIRLDPKNFTDKVPKKERRTQENRVANGKTAPAERMF